MLDLTPQLLPRLDSHPLPGLDLGSRGFAPRYDGYSLANLPAGIFRLLGAAPFENMAPALDDALLGPLAGRYRRVVLGVIDGLGLEQFQAALADPEIGLAEALGEEAVLAPLTSVVPATTATALTTLWTGAYPAEHGVVGYEMYLKEYGVTANMILHAPATFAGDVGSLSKAGFRPETFLPMPAVGAGLADQGVQTTVLQYYAIARSGLSTMLFQGAKVAPVWSLSDLFITLKERLSARGTGREYLYFYWSALDDLMHRYNPGDERVRLELSMLARHLGHFLAQARSEGQGDTLFLLTADHGHVSTPLRSVCDLREQPELLDCLSMLPAGESRLAFAFLRPGREQRFLKGVEQAWPGRLRVYPSEQAVAAGLFGPSGMHPRLPDRVGDVILAAQGDTSLWWANKENVLLGRHGGLTRTEMLVPLVATTI